jgi:putative effector of murein hydrolase
LLIITLLKISFYDIWNNIDNAILGIIAFMFVGGVMIYISTLYSKNKLSFKEDLLFDIFKKNDENKIDEKI